MNGKILYWTPRILMILALLFMLMFSFDVFEGNETFIRKLGGFFIHNIPVLVLGALLAVAWFRELEGGILITAAAIYACIRFHSFTTNKGSLIIFIPFILAAVLFIVHHFMYRTKKV
jgi:hypothetical protein